MRREEEEMKRQDADSFDCIQSMRNKEKILGRLFSMRERKKKSVNGNICIQCSLSLLTQIDAGSILQKKIQSSDASLEKEISFQCLTYYYFFDCENQVLLPADFDENKQLREHSMRINGQLHAQQQQPVSSFSGFDCT